MVLRLYLFYYKKVMRYALPLSCLAFIGYVGISAIAAERPIVAVIWSFIPWFLFILLLLGPAFSIFVYHRFRYYEYDFYRNRGVTFKRIMFFTATTNLILLVPCIINSVQSFGNLFSFHIMLIWAVVFG